LKLNTAETGQATVEFALVLPFLFLFSLSVVQVGSIANDQLALGHAARSAARAISLGDVTDQSANQIATNAVDNTITLNNVRIDIELGDKFAQVALSYTRKINIPIIGRLINEVTLHSSATMPRESQETS
jgi:Flp pilus assembly protein TadG